MYGLSFGIVYGKIEEGIPVLLSCGRRLEVSFRILETQSAIKFVCYARSATHTCGYAIAVLTDFRINDETLKIEATCISLNRVLRGSNKLNEFIKQQYEPRYNFAHITGILLHVDFFAKSYVVQTDPEDENKKVHLRFRADFLKIKNVGMQCLFYCFVFPDEAYNIRLDVIEAIAVSPNDPSLLESLDAIKYHTQPHVEAQINIRAQQKTFKRFT